MRMAPSGGEMVVPVWAPKIEVTRPMSRRLRPQVASSVSTMRP
jgi:hypothetical protein